eukprot:5060763-Prymnesium_polylepis.1
MVHWASKRAAAAAIIEEYEDSEAGASTTTEMTEAEHTSTIGRAAHTPLLRRMFGRLVGTAEEKDKLVKRGRPRPRRVQRQCTITVPTDALLETLSQKLLRVGSASSDDSGATLEATAAELSALMRRQLRHELHESTLGLLDAFDLLAAEAVTPHGTAHRAGGGADQLESLSDRFIDDLCALMLRANYRLFSQREWHFAQKENFMFTLPVTPARRAPRTPVPAERV